MKKIACLVAIVFFCLPSMAQDTVDFHPAEFPGGNMGWIKYLEHNLKRELGGQYLTIPQGQTSAKQTVKLSFDISADGHISHITVDNPEEVHPELAKEGIRIIAKSPVWKPAFQDGKAVPDKRKQNISFMNGTP